jgi:hypothetical protein
MQWIIQLKRLFVISAAHDFIMLGRLVEDEVNAQPKINT